MVRYQTGLRVERSRCKEEVVLERDRARLTAPYAPGEFSQDTHYIMIERAGWPLDGLRDLEDAIFQDLDTERYGIRWWQTQLPPRTRILVGDHLAHAVSSLPEALLEAHLHLSSWRRLQTGVRGPAVHPNQRPERDLRGCEEELHFAGYFRALGTALDVLAAVIVGVAGLKTLIRKASWADVRNRLQKSQYSAQAAALRLEDSISNCGPPGWDQWMLDMRHTLVHRPRRSTMTFPGLFGTQYYEHLPSCPARSDVEGNLDSRSEIGSVLFESAESTLSGMFVSTAMLLQETGNRLMLLWGSRRMSPDWIPQPPGQWEDQPPACSGFRGYVRNRTPEALDMSGGTMVVSEKFGHRLKAGALLDTDRAIWRDID